MFFEILRRKNRPTSVGPTPQKAFRGLQSVCGSLYLFNVGVEISVSRFQTEGAECMSRVVCSLRYTSEVGLGRSSRGTLSRDTFWT